MNIVKIMQIALVAGVLLIGYGEFDDSPGAQGIGLLSVLCSLAVGAHYLYCKYTK